MCGLAGIMRRDKNALDNVNEVDEMLLAIKHRGPDDTGVCGIDSRNNLFSEKSSKDLKMPLWAVLGFNRLSIQDVSQAGHQPMMSPDGSVVITFNGEIYNVAELRERLLSTDKYIFRSMSDTEVILYLYMEYGFEKMTQMLNGMFAIVLYDSKEDKLYFTRDRFGIIPLHIMIKHNLIVWASEIKCFLFLTDFKRNINKKAVNNAFMFCYSNNSMYEDADSVEPGTILEWNAKTDQLRLCRYFDINDYEQDNRLDYNKNLLEQAVEVTKRCVERQLISDVNLGVQFSGGVDSTLLAGFVSDAYQKQNLDLHGFSLTNRNFHAYDEEEWLDKAASKIAISLHKYDMNMDTFWENFEHGIYAYERLVNIPSPIGIYEFSKNARRDVTVLISGEGADELCGGYGTFSNYKFMEELGLLLHIEKISPSWKTKDCIGHVNEFLLGFDSQLSEKQCKILLDEYETKSILEDRLAFWKQLKGTSFDKIRKLYFNYTLISLLERQNKICMANSVENRVPFLDNEMVDFMFKVPENELLHRQYHKIITNKKINTAGCFEGKYLLKKMSADRYGKQFAYRKKQAIRVPLSEYLKNDKFLCYLNEQIVSSMKQRGLINMKTFNDAFMHLGEENNALMVWKAVNMEAWCQMFVDGRKPFSIV